MKSPLRFIYPIMIAFIIAFPWFWSASVLNSAEDAMSHYQKGMELEKKQQYDAAVHEIQEAIQIDPNNFQFYYALGELNLILDDAEDAVQNLEKAIELNPELKTVHDKLGLAYNKLNDYEKSLTAFLKAIEYEPNRAVLYNNAGQDCYMLKQLDEAEKYLKKALELDNTLTIAYINLGNVYVERGDFGNAVVTGEKAVGLEPNNPIAHNNLSFAYFRTGDMERALEEMQKALELQPDNPNFKRNFQFLKQKQQEAIKQQALAEKTEEQQPPPAPTTAKEVESEKTLNMPREITLKEVLGKKAEEEKQISVPPSPEPTPETIAKEPETEQKAKKEEQPEIKEEKTEKKEEQPLPTDEQVEKINPALKFYTKALKSAAKGDTAEAKRQIEKSLRLEPDNPDYLTFLGLLNDLQGSLDTAVAVHQQVIKANPSHSAAHNNLGHAYQMQKKYADSEQEYAEAYNLDRSNVCAAANLGSMKVYAGNCDDAERFLSIALDYGCLQAGTFSNLALCEYQAGNAESAMSLMRNALAKSPNNHIIRENYTFLQVKTKIPAQTIVLPKGGLSSYIEFAEKELNLAKLAPVEPLSFHETFVRNWKPKTVLVVPFPNPRGAERLRPKPSEVITKALQDSIDKNEYFKLIKIENYEGGFKALQEPGSIEKLLKRYPADLVFIGEQRRTYTVEETTKKMFGLKKRQILKAVSPVRVMILDGHTLQPLYQGEMMGEAAVEGASDSDLTATQRRSLHQKAFNDFCEDLNYFLKDYYNLIGFGEGRIPVKYKVERGRAARYM